QRRERWQRGRGERGGGWQRGRGRQRGGGWRRRLLSPHLTRAVSTAGSSPRGGAGRTAFAGDRSTRQRHLTVRLRSPRDLKGGPDTRPSPPTKVPDFPGAGPSRSGGTRRADVRQ